MIISIQETYTPSILLLRRIKISQLFSNNASSTLLASISSSATALSVIPGDQIEFPVISVAGDFFMLTLQVNGVIEIVKVTATSGNTYTVSRGQEGTTPIAWSAGTTVELRLTAGGLQKLQTDIGTTGVVNLGTGSTVNSYAIWHAGNMGHGSGLDADTVDGIHGTALAPLASPALTGTPTAPTAAADTNTTQIATTAFVVGQAGSTTPTMNGGGSAGASLKYARADHVHPTDTSLAPKLSPIFTGQPEAPTAVAGTSTAQIATTAFVIGQAANMTPLANGIATSGTNTHYSRADHVHPVDSGKLDASSYTAADVKIKLMTVDGIGSGVDSDLLDGQEGSFYQDPANLSAAVPVSKGGTGKTSIGNNNFLKGTTGNAYVERTPSQVLGDIGAQSFDQKLENISNIGVSSVGFITHTGEDIIQTRSITSDNTISITNSDGGGGNVSLSVNAANLNIEGMQGTLSVDRGGTGINSYAIGDILYASSPTTLSVLPAPVSGTGLVRMNSSGVPSYDTNIYQLASTPDTITSVFGRTGAVTAASGDYASFYQTLDADLTAIAGLAGTSGLLRKTAANTWSLDTTPYLTGNQSITLSGAVTGTGTTAIVTALNAPLNDLTDVVITTPTVNQVLAYNGTNWVNVNSSVVTGITEAPVDGQKYVRQNANWVVDSGGVAWGSITGTLSNQTDLNTALNSKLNGNNSQTVGSGTTELTPLKLKLSPTSHTLGNLEIKSGVASAIDTSDILRAFPGVESLMLNANQDALISDRLISFIPSLETGGFTNTSLQAIVIGPVSSDVESTPLVFSKPQGATTSYGELQWATVDTTQADGIFAKTPVVSMGVGVDNSFYHTVFNGKINLFPQTGLRVQSGGVQYTTYDLNPSSMNMVVPGVEPAPVFEIKHSGTDDGDKATLKLSTLTGSVEVSTGGTIGDHGKLVVSGQVKLPASTTSRASLNIPIGVAPTSPVDGDLWTVNNGLVLRVNAATVEPLIPALGQTVKTVIISSGSITLNMPVDVEFDLLLNANVTTVNIASVSFGRLYKRTLRIRQDATGGRTFSVPASWKFPSALGAYVVSSAANAIDILQLSTYDGGTTWYVTYDKNFV